MTDLSEDSLDVGLPVDFASVASAMLELDVIVSEGHLEADVRDEWAAKFDELQKMLEFIDEKQRTSEDRNIELARTLRDEILALEQARLRNVELIETADAADEERKRITNELTAMEAMVSNSQSNANEVIELQNVISIFLYYLSNTVRKFFISVKIA